MDVIRFRGYYRILEMLVYLFSVSSLGSIYKHMYILLSWSHLKSIDGEWAHIAGRLRETTDEFRPNRVSALWEI